MMDFQPYLTRAGGIKATQPIEIKYLWFLHRQVAVHSDIYDYSKVVYSTARNKVEILCKHHGKFFQTPDNHLKGVGCPKCQRAGLTKTTEECIQDFIEAHGNTYDYSKVVYYNAATKVEILCKEHGSFLQRPRCHLSGQGCPKCQNCSQDTLYILKCLNTNLYKIGITSNIKRRISSIGGNLKLIFNVAIEDPRVLEKQLHNRYKFFNTFNPSVRSGGTEFFRLTEDQVEGLIQEIK